VPLDVGTVLAVVVALDTLSLGLTFETYRKAQEPDDRVQETAEKAQAQAVDATEAAARAHRRLDDVEEDRDAGEPRTRRGAGGD
jgi:predicted cobalt transporter CbtA